MDEYYADFPGVKRDTLERMTTTSWLERLGRDTVEMWTCPKCGLFDVLGRSNVMKRQERRCTRCNPLLKNELKLTWG